MKLLLIVEGILDQFLKINKFQDYVNRKANIKYGSKIIYHSNNTTIEEVFSQYKFNDIQPTDIVLDIGANVGGFSLFVSKFVKQVYAVEPILTDILRKNIKLNNISNIIVLDYALGNEVRWNNMNKIVKGKSLCELISICGSHIDFLKCDCEGGEWCITSNELNNIRRIEMEVHNFDRIRDFNDYLKMLDNAGFRYTYEIVKETDMLVHANRRSYDNTKILKKNIL